MSKKQSEKIVQNLLDNTVSANEFTGSFQLVDLDKEQLEEYRRKFNKDKKKK